MGPLHCVRHLTTFVSVTHCMLSWARRLLQWIPFVLNLLWWSNNSLQWGFLNKRDTFCPAAFREKSPPSFTEQQDRFLWLFLVRWELWGEARMSPFSTCWQKSIFCVSLVSRLDNLTVTAFSSGQANLILLHLCFSDFISSNVDVKSPHESFMITLDRFVSGFHAFILPLYRRCVITPTLDVRWWKRLTQFCPKHVINQHSAPFQYLFSALLFQIWSLDLLTKSI